MRLAFASLTVLALAACSAEPTRDGAEPDAGTTTEEDGPVVFLSPTDHLVRVAAALTGERPSAEDLRAVRDDPEAISGIVDRYLASDGFGVMIRDLYNEALQVRAGGAIYPAGFPPVGALAGSDLQSINTSVMEAPLRLIEHVVTNDHPLTEIVTGDYAIADGAVAAVWGLSYDGDGSSWEVTGYEDERPLAGILSDSWLFTRHSTTYSNQNRGRANTISRALLCNDYVERQLEVDTSINLADPEEVANAVASNSACASCHQTLDPLASYFASYQPLLLASTLTAYPVDFFQPEVAPLFSVRDSGYFGFSGGDVQYLGALIAEDPRFSLCAARRFYAYLHQVPLGAVPQTDAASLQGVLVDSDFSAKALAKAVVLSDAFRTSHPRSEEHAADAGNLLKVRPWQLARLVETLAGFRWEADLQFSLEHGVVGRMDLLSDSLFGYEVLAGGIDSQSVALPSHTMTATTSLVLSGLAAQASEAVIEEVRANANGGHAFVGIDVGSTGESDVRRALSDLHLRLFGQFDDPDSDAVTLSYGLFRDALAATSGDAARAWKVTAYALLQDIRIAYY